MGITETVRDAFLRIRREEDATVLRDALAYLDVLADAGARGIVDEVPSRALGYLTQLGLARLDVRIEGGNVWAFRYCVTPRGTEMREAQKK